jgi:hypothetical protein
VDINHVAQVLVILFSNKIRVTWFSDIVKI